MYVFREPPHQVLATVARLREVYPDADVFLGYDGGTPYGVQGAEEIAFSHAKEDRFGGLWTHRYLTVCLSRSRQPFVMRVDPDTECLRRMDRPAFSEGLFGCYRNIGTPEYPAMFLHGAALGFTRATAEEFVANGWMLSPEFINSAFKTVDDKMVLHVARERGISIHDRPDFSCGLLGQCANPTFRHRRPWEPEFKGPRVFDAPLGLLNGTPLRYCQTHTSWL